MRFVLSSLFLSVSFTIFSQGSCLESNIFSVAGITGNKITGIEHDGKVLNKIPKNAVGFPVYHVNIDVCYSGSNSNRYLLKYLAKYCIADSNLRIIIDWSDTIIPLTLYDPEGTNIIMNYNGEQDTFSCLFQAVNNDTTQLLSNDGSQFTTLPFKGYIYDWDISRIEDLEKPFLRTYSSSPDKRNISYGLIRTNGETIFPNIYAEVTEPKYGLLPNYLVLRDHSNHFSVFSTTSSKIVFSARNLHPEYPQLDIFLFEQKDLYGLYHPTLGVLLKPKYKRIYIDKTARYNGTPFHDRVLVKKNNEKSIWKIPQELIDLYNTPTE